MLTDLIIENFLELAGGVGTVTVLLAYLSDWRTVKWWLIFLAVVFVAILAADTV